MTDDWMNKAFRDRRVNFGNTLRDFVIKHGVKKELASGYLYIAYVGHGVSVCYDETKNSSIYIDSNRSGDLSEDLEFLYPTRGEND